MRASICFLVLTALLACNNPSANRNKSDGNFPVQSEAKDNHENQITCWGIGDIEFEDAFSDIERKVGKNNLSLDSLFLEGTFERIVTTLWKGTPEEITIHWNESAPPFKSIKTLEISNPASPYHFINGITIGSKLKDIADLNKAPVSLYGFGWDYGGTFASFGKGKLAGDIPCFGGVFELVKTENTQEISALMGDKQISSSDPAFENQEARLKVIRISNGK